MNVHSGDEVGIILICQVESLICGHREFQFLVKFKRCFCLAIETMIFYTFQENWKINNTNIVENISGIIIILVVLYLDIFS